MNILEKTQSNLGFEEGMTLEEYCKHYASYVKALESSKLVAGIELLLQTVVREFIQKNSLKALSDEQIILKASYSTLLVSQAVINNPAVKDVVVDCAGIVGLSAARKLLKFEGELLKEKIEEVKKCYTKKEVNKVLGIGRVKEKDSKDSEESEESEESEDMTLIDALLVFATAEIKDLLNAVSGLGKLDKELLLDNCQTIIEQLENGEEEEEEKEEVV